MIKEIPDAGKTLYSVLGSRDFLSSLSGPNHCSEVGVDLEFVFASESDREIKRILRFQTAGPTQTWIPSNMLLVTPSVVIDLRPERIDSICELWEKAGDILLEWLSKEIHPKVIEPLIGC